MNVSRQTWLSVAAVAAVFSFIVIALMFGYHLRPQGEDPLDSAEWVKLKADLKERPKDTAAADRLRDLDLELRQDFFLRRERIRNGGALLLVGIIIALVAVKGANRRSRPEPDAPVAFLDTAERDRRNRSTGRALTVVVGVLLAGAVWLWMSDPAAIPAPGQPEIAPPGSTTAGPPTLEQMAAQWPSFRGHDGSGVAPTDDVPRAWNGESGENIAWKTKIPLPGTNSPVVWGDSIFLTGASARREEVYCIDAATGAMRWKKGLVVVGRREEPPEPMEDTGYAAPTAATDGRYVYVLFTSGRVAAFDFEGQQIWLKSFGPFENTYGHSSSLVLFEDRVILQLDHGYADAPLARVLALDAANGKTVWETARVVDSSWSSPVVVRTPAGPQLLLSATPLATAYDPATGKEIWRAEVMYGEVAPAPVHHGGVAFFAQEDVGMFAIATDGTGDVTSSHVLWNEPGSAPDVTSPVCDGERVYMVTTGGTLTCMHAETGVTIWQQELEADYYSSPSRVGNLLYLTSMDGETLLIETGEEYREVGRNPLGEGVVASAAFGPGRIYLRAKDHLYAIGGKR